MGIADDIIGTHFRYPDYFEVGREKVKEFAQAVQDDHPAHFSEEAAAECGSDTLIASLTFIAVAGRLPPGRYDLVEREAWSLAALVARLRGLLRRSGATTARPESQIVVGDLIMDEDSHEVTRAGEAINR